MYKRRRKKGTRNYRNISISSSVRKRLEPTVNASIIKYLTNNNLLNQNKGDFRSNDSVDTNLTTTATTTTNNSLQHQAT